MKDRKIFTPKNELTPEQLEKRRARENKIRIISAVVFLAAAVGITYLLYPFFSGIGEDGWAESVQEQISGYSGLRGVTVFLALQSIQVVIAIVPAVQVVGGALYGSILGTVLSYIGIALGSLMVWGVVKKLGTPLVEAVINEKHRKKLSFLEDNNNLIFILIILYLIPGIPKDALTYIVPLTKIKMRDFFLYVLPFRLPAIILSAAFGSNVTKGNYTATIVVISVIIGIAIFGIFFKDKILKKLSKRKNHSKINKNHR